MAFANVLSECGHFPVHVFLHLAYPDAFLTNKLAGPHSFLLVHCVHGIHLAPLLSTSSTQFQISYNLEAALYTSSKGAWSPNTFSLYWYTTSPCPSTTTKPPKRRPSPFKSPSRPGYFF